MGDVGGCSVVLLPSYRKQFLSKLLQMSLLLSFNHSKSSVF